MKKVWFTIPRWLFNKKNEESWSINDIIDCCDKNEKGLPINFKEAVIEGKIIKETEKAIQIFATTYELGLTKIWLPKSQIIESKEVA